MADLPSQKPQGPPQPSPRTSQTRQVQVAEAFSGPLPHPEILQMYNQVEPGLANRIVKMAEDEAAHRRSMEERAISIDDEAMRRDKAEIRLGQVFAFGIGVFTVSASVYAATHGAEAVGGIIGTTVIVALVSAFIIGRHSPKP